MFPLVLLLLIVVPIVELWVLSQVADSLGWLPSIGILLAISLIGGMLMRWQTAGAIRRVTDTLQQGRMPTNELADAALMIFGAALLLTPGFFTDAFGLAMFIPPTRAIARRIALTQFKRRSGNFATVTFGDVAAATAARSRRPSGSFIDVEEVDVERTDRMPNSAHEISPTVPPGAAIND